jgi:hypothetical protein
MDRELRLMSVPYSSLSPAWDPSSCSVILSRGDSTNTIPRKIDDRERRRISGTAIRSSSPSTNRA